MFLDELKDFRGRVSAFPFPLFLPRPKERGVLNPCIVPFFMVGGRTDPNWIQYNLPIVFFNCI